MCLKIQLDLAMKDTMSMKNIIAKTTKVSTDLSKTMLNVCRFRGEKRKLRITAGESIVLFETPVQMSPDLTQNLNL